MNLSGSPLVLTKLRAPAARARIVPRAHLVDLLTQKDGAGLVLVCAPAGYGKTTLLAEWAQALMKDGTAVAWVALDPSDDDPIPFCSYLIASFIQALGPIPELTQIAQLLRSSPEIDPQRILPAAMNAIVSSDRECVLILDDYHLIGAPAIHSALVFLLEHLPENLRIAIGSRSDPPLPLARLRARGQMLEIRTAGLRFNSGESARFLNEIMRLGLSPDGINALEERTEGWVAGLQLVALSLSSRADKEQVIASFTGSHRYLVEYLMEEVVDRQPEEIQSFLLSTSILERLCAPLCDQILADGVLRRTDSTAAGRFDSQTALEHLEKSNLFMVPLDDEGTWYRYHHLFRDFLRTRLGRIAPERINSSHRAACEWLAEHAFLREAAYHAFQTQDWEYAAAFVEQHGFTLIVHSDIATLYEWCSAFPEEVMQRHPMLCLQQGLALAYSFRRQNRSRVEARLQQADRAVAALDDIQAAQEVDEFAAVVHTFLAFAPDPAADPNALLSRAQRMLGAYPEGDPGRFSGVLLTGYAYLALQDAQAADRALEEARQIALGARLYFGIVESSFNLARLAHHKGQLRRAEEICHQAQNDIVAMMSNPEQELPALGSLDVELGCVLLERNQLDQAGQHLRRGLELLGGGANPYYLMTAFVALFRLYEIQGRWSEAIQRLERLEAAWPDIAFCTRGLRVTHASRNTPNDPSALADAANWCQSFSPPADESAATPGMGPLGATEAYYLAGIAWLRAQIALGKTKAAMPYLARLLDAADTRGLTSRVIELSVLEAHAWLACGDNQRACAALERALGLAQSEESIRAFDQGIGLAQLLIEAAQHGNHKEFATRVLIAIGVSATPRSGVKGSGAGFAQTPYNESLSEREMDVLRLVSQGATNHDIAERLVITEGTVKSHVNHILGKLDAHNRTEAVARAREWGLLEI